MLFVDVAIRLAQALLANGSPDLSGLLELKQLRFQLGPASEPTA
jgi:hypothetical protein